MTDNATSPMTSELAEVLRWIIVIPVFAVLVLLAFNATLGFLSWLYVDVKGGWLFYSMLPVALIILLSNGLTSILACMIAPRKVSAVIFLGIGYLIGLIVTYLHFELTSLTSGVIVIHAVMVYVGLFIVFYLDRLNSKNQEPEGAQASS